MSPAWTELNTAADLVAEYAPLIKGKTILTTGVTPGSIGASFVEALAAASPALLILAGRTPSKLDAEAAAVAEKNPSVKTKTVVVDLLSLDSVRAAAAEVNGWSDVPAIDVLVNCAGIMAVPYAKSADGYESQFAANHLAHFLLTNLLMPKILAAPAPRVVNVSSSGHRLHPIRFADANWQDGATYEKWYAYGQSKTANMLMALQLSRVLGGKGLVALSLHPGLIMGTGLSAHLDFSNEPTSDFLTMMTADRLLGNTEGFGDGLGIHTALTNEQGAATKVYASFEPSLKGMFLTVHNYHEGSLLTI